ncbi:phosphotransferase [Arthrobacter sp. H5]|uniref:phosphotransferase n=1 Tax=Arthrobacter sp. H5 TaxID=1267973 RepID=UPI00047F4F1B|nr:phosphotransferase [Arthrobacter sp. H5]
MVIHVPSVLPDRQGRNLTVHRAWPRDAGRLIFEAIEADSGRIRAGSIDASGLVRVAPYGEDPVLVGLPRAAAEATLLVHRYKRRAVVRGSNGYTKILARGKARSVASSHNAMTRFAAASGIVVPAVIDQTAGNVTVTAVPGLSLHDLGSGLPAFPDRRSDSQDHWQRAWQLWSLRWPRLAVTAPPDGGSRGALAGGTLAAHTARDECVTVSRWVAHAAAFGALPVAEDRLHRAAARVAHLLLAGTGPAVLAHRDLHDKQLLFNPAGNSVGLIDCDTLALAEPALDLGNLLVHLDFRVLQGTLPEYAAAVARRAVLDAADAMEVPRPRLRAYASATALRLACVYAFRPPHRELAARWFDATEADLADRDMGSACA